MAVKSPTLASVALVASSSPSAQYVLAGSEGPVATFNFKATDGEVTINEIEFTITNPENITSITVGGVTKTVNSSPTNVTGLNIEVPAHNAGISVPVSVKYKTVGTNGITTDTNVSQVKITKVKYTAGNTTLIFGDESAENLVSAKARQMTIVGGLPTVNLKGSTRTNLSEGSTLLAEVEIGALGNGGPIQVKQLPVKISATNVTSFGDFSVKVGNDTIALDSPTAADTGEKH